jgi:hypothetical protein
MNRNDLKRLSRLRLREAKALLNGRYVAFAVNWAIVKDWTEESRYQLHTSASARGIYAAVTDKRHGVLRWLKHHW